MKYLILCVYLLFQIGQIHAQQVQHIDKLELGRKDKHVFNQRGDSSIVLKIDTLIMKNRSRLEFFGKKDVKLEIAYAEIGDKVLFLGQDGKNNASNFDIDIHFAKLGSMQILAKGIDALNGSKTYPNGNGGKVVLRYDTQGIHPQSSDRKAKHYLAVDVQPGGLRVNPSSEIGMIYDRVASAPSGLRGLPQGQIYSGSPGKEGSVSIEEKK